MRQNVSGYSYVMAAQLLLNVAPKPLNTPRNPFGLPPQFTNIFALGDAHFQSHEEACKCMENEIQRLRYNLSGFQAHIDPPLLSMFLETRLLWQIMSSMSASLALTLAQTSANGCEMKCSASAAFWSRKAHGGLYGSICSILDIIQPPNWSGLYLSDELSFNYNADHCYWMRNKVERL